ncbi:MAG TPA: hypothetical protein VII76_06105 [Acidimicrobiales bacterium]
MLTGAVAILGSVLCVAPPAGATTATYVDPRPCSPAVNGGACISQVDTSFSTGTVNLSVTVGLATDPTTNPSWFSTVGQAYVEWFIIPSNDPTSIYKAEATDLSPGQFLGFVTKLGNSGGGCPVLSGVVTASFNISANVYSMSFPSACLADTPSFMVVAEYHPNASVTASQSPDSGYCCTVSESTVPPAPSPVTAPAFTQGYDLAAADGGVFNFGTAPFEGSVGGSPLDAPVVGMAGDVRSGGYWEVASDGGVFSFDAPFHGSMGGTALNAPIVGMVSDNLTGGYWLVASDGGVFAFDAPFYGSMGGAPLNQPIVGMAAMPFGTGYWLVAKDGGVFAFGNAAFDGSMGGSVLHSPVVGMAADTSTGGYWLVASDGGVFAFDAPFDGSMGGTGLDAPIVGMAAPRDAGGYWLVGSDGGIFNFGDAEFAGSMGGSSLDAPVVGMAPTL